jgi:mannose-6-phosphate isomerase
VTLLTKRMVEKPWGKDVLPAPFVAPEGQRIGEVWFEPTPEMPSILVKYIFTSEKLSVQVHPSDAQAAALGETDGGKEECWLVIDAEPGAMLGIGFKKPIDAAGMRKAALDGSIEGLLDWYPAKRGDFFYIPAGTVHAIDAGVSLIEIQQNSDITYRMFDYGRPRPLHLDKAIAVAKGDDLPAECRSHFAGHGTHQLVNGPLLVVSIFEGRAPQDRFTPGPCLVLPMNCAVLVDNVELAVGECGFASSSEQVIAEESAQWMAISPAS